VSVYSSVLCNIACARLVLAAHKSAQEYLSAHDDITSTGSNSSNSSSSKSASGSTTNDSDSSNSSNTGASSAKSSSDAQFATQKNDLVVSSLEVVSAAIKAVEVHLHSQSVPVKSSDGSCGIHPLTGQPVVRTPVTTELVSTE
jgi:cytoskeletal protein RodZ